MIKRIVCALDGSTHAEKALALCIDIAAKYEAHLMLLHILLRNLDADELRRFSEVEGISKPEPIVIKRLETVDSRIEVGHAYEDKPVPSGVLATIGQHILQAARRKAEEAGVREVQCYVADGDPAKRILELAKQQSADCIFMGSRGLGDAKALLQGSVSRKVSNRSTCTCVCVK